jgi:HSP20 family protein
MADVSVKKQQSSEADETSLQRRQPQRGAAGRWDPGFSLIPSDFYSADPFSIMRRFQDEMDRTLSRFFGGSRSSEGGSGRWSPAIEVAEQNGQLQVRAELPGLKPDDVKVEITEDALVIQGERKYEHEEEKGGVYRSERRYGQFYREIPLPEGVNAEQAKAQFNDGVLEVTLPVPEQKSNRRSIPIEGTSKQQK